jgi:hypothetical protein
MAFLLMADKMVTSLDGPFEGRFNALEKNLLTVLRPSKGVADTDTASYLLRI